MSASDDTRQIGAFVICRNLTGAAWVYWTGIGVRKRRQQWRADLSLACRFHRAENAAATIARLDAPEAIVTSADCIVVDD